MSLRKGLATTLCALVAGTALVSQSRGGCYNCTPYPIESLIYDTSKYAGLIGFAIILGTIPGVLYGILSYKNKKEEEK